MITYSRPLLTEKETRMLLGKVPAGNARELFDEYELIDLDAYLQTGTREMIYARVTGFSMIEAGISDGDLLVIELNDRPRSGDIVVASINGEVTVKYWDDVRNYQQKRFLRLVPANRKFLPVAIGQFDDFRVIGIVRHKVSSF